MTSRNSHIPGSSKAKVASVLSALARQQHARRALVRPQMGESHEIDRGVFHGLARTVENLAGHVPPVRAHQRRADVQSDRPAQPAVLALLLGRLLVVQALRYQSGSMANELSCVAMTTITTTETMWMLIRLARKIGQNKCREGFFAAV